MDTHVTSAPELEPETGLSARLPGEPDPDALGSANPSDQPEPLARAPTPPTARRRSGLLAGVAIGVVMLAGGAFVLSPYNHLVPMPARVTTTVHHLAAQAGLGADKPFAPAASLARVQLPAQQSAIVTPRYQPQKSEQDLKEILAMRAGSHPANTARSGTAGSAATHPASASPHPATALATKTTQEKPSPGFVPHEPGSPPAPAGGDALPTRPAATSAPV
ncbi:MAG: hypothetical protein ABI369_08415, partial [Acetobacteraceae bacterium]